MEKYYGRHLDSEANAVDTGYLQSFRYVMDLDSAAKVFVNKVTQPGVVSNAELWDWLWKNGGAPWVSDSVHP